MSELLNHSFSNGIRGIIYQCMTEDGAVDVEILEDIINSIIEDSKEPTKINLEIIQEKPLIKYADKILTRENARVAMFTGALCLYDYVFVKSPKSELEKDPKKLGHFITRLLNPDSFDDLAITMHENDYNYTRTFAPTDREMSLLEHSFSNDLTDAGLFRVIDFAEHDSKLWEDYIKPDDR